MEECCGTCKWSRRCHDGNGNVEFCCGNEDSDMYGAPTFYDDTCDEWEIKPWMEI